MEEFSLKSLDVTLYLHLILILVWKVIEQCVLHISLDTHIISNPNETPPLHYSIDYIHWKNNNLHKWYQSLEMSPN